MIFFEGRHVGSSRAQRLARGIPQHSTILLASMRTVKIIVKKDIFVVSPIYSGDTAAETHSRLNSAGIPHAAIAPICIETAFPSTGAGASKQYSTNHFLEYYTCKMTIWCDGHMIIGHFLHWSLGHSTQNCFGNPR